jgi:hypothetical protein
MPPKRKDNSGTSAVSGPKAKRSKSTPTFRTPTASTTGLGATPASEVNSTKNRVVTLRASASGRRGYRTQDLDTSSNSNNAFPSPELSDLPSHIPDECDSIPHPAEVNDIHPQNDLGAKPRPKQKNTTTVRQHLIIAGISLSYNIDKTYRMAGLSSNLLR